MIKFFIDNRETHFTELLKENSKYDEIEVEYKQLDIGDFILDSENLTILIERKTIDDFQKSIVDGRYRDQKRRLLEYATKDEKEVKIVYLIEGSINQITAKYEKIFWGMVVNSILRDGIFIIQAPTLSKSVSIVINMYEKMVKNNFTNNNLGKEINLTMSSFKKSSYMSPESCYKAQLCQIPGISMKIADAIHLEYQSLPILIENISNLEREEKIKKLSQIMITGNKTSRKLGVKKAEKIIEHIFFN
jgi:ERCC4-type nuclease